MMLVWYVLVRIMSHIKIGSSLFPIYTATCSNGALRLTGGYIPTEGTLEVCNNGAWSIICADNFQDQDGFVACRQLGYPATGKKTTLLESERFCNIYYSNSSCHFISFHQRSWLSNLDQLWLHRKWVSTCRLFL